MLTKVLSIAIIVGFPSGSFAQTDSKSYAKELAQELYAKFVEIREISSREDIDQWRGELTSIMNSLREYGVPLSSDELPILEYSGNDATLTRAIQRFDEVTREYLRTGENLRSAWFRNSRWKEVLDNVGNARLEMPAPICLPPRNNDGLQMTKEILTKSGSPPQTSKTSPPSVSFEGVEVPEKIAELLKQERIKSEGLRSREIRAYFQALVSAGVKNPPKKIRLITREQIGYRKARSNMEPANYFDQITIHHTEGLETQDPRSIQNHHLDGRNWADIGYHFLIKFNQETRQWELLAGRDIHFQGAHAAGNNKGRIGIAIVGNFVPWDPVDNPHGSIEGYDLIPRDAAIFVAQVVQQLIDGDSDLWNQIDPERKIKVNIQHIAAHCDVKGSGTLCMTGPSNEYVRILHTTLMGSPYVEKVPMNGVPPSTQVAKESKKN